MQATCLSAIHLSAIVYVNGRRHRCIVSGSIVELTQGVKVIFELKEGLLDKVRLKSKDDAEASSLPRLSKAEVDIFCLGVKLDKHLGMVQCLDRRLGSLG